MKILICSLLIVWSGLMAGTLNRNSVGSASDLHIKVIEVAHSGKVSLNILNISDKPIRIWKESNSWGAAHWRVLAVSRGQLTTFFQNPDQGFTKNNPAYDEIPVGGHLEKTLDLNGINWRGGSGPGKVEFSPGDTVIVVYDVPKIFPFPEAHETVEASTMGVWYGVAATSVTVQ